MHFFYFKESTQPQRNRSSGKKNRKTSNVWWFNDPWCYKKNKKLVGDCLPIQIKKILVFVYKRCDQLIYLKKLEKNEGVGGICIFLTWKLNKKKISHKYSKKLQITRKNFFLFLFDAIKFFIKNNWKKPEVLHGKLKTVLQ